jgi:hypothetical protein
MSLTPDDLKKLSQPFDSKTIGIKVNSFSKDRTKAMLVCYLQHTDVYGRLDSVDPDWSCETTWEMTRGEHVYVQVKLTVKGVSRENVGDGEDHKSATSDALKRAAMLFGIGRYLYDAETVWVPYNDQTDRFKTYTLADYEAALRKGQSKLPTSDQGPTNNPAAKPAQGLKAVPASQPETGEMTREQVGKEIMKVAKEIRLGDKEMGEWVNDQFKKPINRLSLEEMKAFLGTLQKELGQERLFPNGR